MCAFHVECGAHVLSFAEENQKGKYMAKKTANLLGLSVVLPIALAFAIGAAASLRSVAAKAGSSGYHVAKHIPIKGEGGWDYLIVDDHARRLYLSHSTHTVVLDADSAEVVGDIPDTQGVHGIALAPDLGRGFTSNGKSNSVTIFDLKTLKTLGTAKTGTNPDAIIYEPVTRRVFAFNGRSKDATVINANDNSVVSTFPVGGKPEFAAVDGLGSVFVNVEDTSELLHIDAKDMKVLHRWPLAPCKEPTGLAIDVKSHRLFAACDNEMMAVVDASSGKVVATPKTGEGADAAAFDPDSKYAFSSNGESGTLTVLHQDSADTYSVVENVPTKKGARTMALDAKTHNIFLPAADMVPPGPGQKWPTAKPGTFELLLVTK
jgi:DNA-binding beta-propeller fold protein YncE